MHMSKEINKNRPQFKSRLKYSLVDNFQQIVQSLNFYYNTLSFNHLRKKIQTILLLNHTQKLLYVYQIMILKIRLQTVLEKN